MITKQAGSILIALSAAVTLALCGCEPISPGAPNTSASTSEQASASSAAKPATDMPTALKELEGVTNVEPLETSESSPFAEKYLLTFEQPLDHDDPSAGTFSQRVVLGIVKGAEANVLETEGYNIEDERIQSDYMPELCSAGKRNFIYVEHRFFGSSVPKGLTNDSVDEWKYLTSKNAAADYHHIYTELSQVLTGKWASTGTSRGGEVCASYTYYYPDDMAISVPYVAPFSSGAEDPRFYAFVYTQIGNERYGEEKAKEYRNLVTSFQVELMKNKSLLAPRLWQYCIDTGQTYRSGVSANLLFDITVLELAAHEWQWGQQAVDEDGVDLSFAGLSAVLAMPEGTEEEQLAKRDAEFVILSSLGTPEDFASNNAKWAYCVGAIKEYGQYQFDFSHLREACSAAGIPDALTVKAEEEKGLFARVLLTDEQQKSLTYDGTFYQGITQWIDDTPTKMVFINASSDPWYSMRMPKTDNEVIKRYVSDTKTHSVRIADFDAKTAKEINDYVDAALDPNAKPKAGLLSGLEDTSTTNDSSAKKADAASSASSSNA